VSTRDFRYAKTLSRNIVIFLIVKATVLTAGMRHMPRHLPVYSLSGVVKVVPFGFAGDRSLDGLDQLGVIIRRGSEVFAQIRLVLLSQAHEQLSGAGQAHPIAAFAEVI